MSDRNENQTGSAAEQLVEETLMEEIHRRHVRGVLGHVGNKGARPRPAWRLHPQVALRPEPFGALLYHFGTRRLSFLQRPHRRQRDHITVGPPDRPLGIAGLRR